MNNKAKNPTRPRKHQQLLPDSDTRETIERKILFNHKAAKMILLLRKISIKTSQFIQGLLTQELVSIWMRWRRDYTLK